jgi:hypothetical protein
MLIPHGADVHAVVFRGGRFRPLGPLHVTLLVLKTLSYGYKYFTIEIERGLIILLEAVCGPNAKDDQGRTLTQRIIHDSANWQVWERALDRVERRKTMSAEGKEKDLSFGARHRTGSDEPSNPVFYVLDLTNTPPHGPQTTAISSNNR